MVSPVRQGMQKHTHSIVSLTHPRQFSPNVYSTILEWRRRVVVVILEGTAEYDVNLSTKDWDILH
jgi:hypothetical protein